jgi:hypothetical protein
MGLHKHEFDSSWFVLKCLERVKLVDSINETMRGDTTNETAIAQDQNELKVPTQNTPQ